MHCISSFSRTALGQAFVALDINNCTPTSSSQLLLQVNLKRHYCAPTTTSVDSRVCITPLLLRRTGARLCTRVFVLSYFCCDRMCLSLACYLSVFQATSAASAVGLHADAGLPCWSNSPIVVCLGLVMCRVCVRRTASPHSNALSCAIAALLQSALPDAAPNSNALSDLGQNLVSTMAKGVQQAAHNMALR